MPRYFFHMRNGEVERDRSGVELPDDECVRAESVRAFAEALEDDPEGFWETGMRELTVTDGDGLTLFALNLSVTEAPAMSRPKS